MKIKEGANYEGMTPLMKNACAIIDAIFNRYDYVCVLTSGKDGVHGEGSLHYEGDAGDFRTRQVIPETRQKIVADCQRELGPDFEVILEDTHMHVERDPQHTRKVKA